MQNINRGGSGAQSNLVKLGALLLAFVSAFIAIDAAISALISPNRSHVFGKWFGISFFTNSTEQRFIALDQQSQTLLKPLEFMVWPRARKQASQAYVRSLQQQLNLSPFSAELWTQLVYAQGEADTELSQRVWAMQRGLTLGRWNSKNRKLLTRSCVTEYQAIISFAEPLCSELLTHLEVEKSMDKLAKDMGLQAELIRRVLLKHGLRAKEDNLR